MTSAESAPVAGRSQLARQSRAWLRHASDWIDLQLSLIVSSLERVAPQARGRLLDVGCGEKPYEPIFRPYVSEYIGVEQRSTFELTAAGSGSGRGPDVLYSGDRLPFPDKSFDTVLSVQVLEHTPRPHQLMQEMSRVLADDGILILLAPFQFRLHEQPHDYFRYSSHGLRQLCSEVGLEVVQVEPQGSLWSVLGHKLNSYLAFRVALLQGLAQSMGKLGHEQSNAVRPRYWALPVVAPSMFAISLGARVLDRVLHEPDETLGFLVVARRAAAARA